MSAATNPAVADPRKGGHDRPLLGLRRTPGRLALMVFRMPLRLYRHGWGWLLGHTFLLLVHVGRKTGKPHDTVAMALSYDRDHHEAVIFSGWGPDADWVHNLQARPAQQVRVGRESFVPEHRFLTEDDAAAVVKDFRRRHPWRVRLASAILGWGNLRSDAAVRRFVHEHPFVSLRPAR
jgi:deazaflavin-dependent oxidoreductase (nitroreductase family)